MNVLITGTSKGIGRELVNQFIADLEVDRIYIGSTQINKFDSKKVIHFPLNYAEDGWQRDVNTVIGESSIGVLINNAGYLKSESFEVSNMEEVKKMFNINYFGPYELVQILMPNLKKGKAHIVNIGSMGGYQGSSKFPGLAAYSSSKAAIANLSECLAEELKEFEIKSNCLALGAVNTEMLAEAFPGYEAPVTAKQMAKYICEFSKSGSNIINGKVIPVSLNNP